MSSHTNDQRPRLRCVRAYRRTAAFRIGATVADALRNLCNGYSGEIFAHGYPKTSWAVPPARLHDTQLKTS
jgi:hypothetical protein